MKKQQLLFVYNANGDLFSTVSDFAHKILSPSLYPCRLCALTYGSFSVKQEWKIFIDNLPVKTTFLHKDEFAKRHKQKVVLPAVFFQSGNAVEEIISQGELENFQSLDELKNAVMQKMESHGKHRHSHL